MPLVAPNPAPAPPPPRGWRRFVPVIAAGYVVIAFVVVVPKILEPEAVITATLQDGILTPAQTETLGMMRELNTYLVSLVTLMFGGLGWYLSQYRPTQSPLIRTMFFSTAGLLAVAYWHAGLAYARTVSELAQEGLGLRPGYSQILLHFQLMFAASALAGVLMLLVFADAVTRGDPAATALTAAPDSTVDEE